MSQRLTWILQVEEAVVEVVRCLLRLDMVTVVFMVVAQAILVVMGVMVDVMVEVKAMVMNKAMVKAMAMEAAVNADEDQVFGPIMDQYYEEHEFEQFSRENFVELN
jgi:hypothetical protein